MKREDYFFLALKQGGVGKKDAETIMQGLTKETLNRITQNEFDRRLIRPVLRRADQLLENICMDDKCEIMNLEKAVNQVLDNKKEMFILMKEYCLEE